MGSFHKGHLPQCFSGLEIQDDSLLVTCIKPEREGERKIIRLCEMDGRDTESAVKLLGREITVSVPRNGIRTYKDTGREVNLLEEEI